MKILNRIKEAGEDGWYHIEVAGEHHGVLSEGKQAMPIVQVIDEEAIESISAAFNRDVPESGMLVDADHLSHDQSQKTEAFGWLLETRVKDGELEGRIEWTDIGLPAIENKRFKFFSTEYDLDGFERLGRDADGVERVRPLRLSGLALTNRPNNKGGRPIKNNDLGGHDDGHNPSNTNMKQLAELLGLDPEASEEEITGAITALQEQVAELEAKAAEAEAKELDAEAEEILNRHEGRFDPKARDEWKRHIIANREGAEKLLESLPEPKAAPQKAGLHNRAQAGVPEPVEAGTEKEGKVSQGRYKRAKQIQNRDSVSWKVAWAQADEH